MKKILKLIPLVLLAVSISSCDVDLASGATNTVGFEAPSADVGVDIGTETEEVIFVYTGNVSDSNRTFSVSVDNEATTADPTSYEVPSEVVIPGGSNVGELPVVIRDINLGDGVSIVLNLQSEGSTLLLQDTITINVTQVCPTNEMILSIVYDDYPGETTWEMYLEGALIDSGGPGSGASFTKKWCVDNGNYTFIIYDAFGDGICCAYGSGSYSITSNGVTVASGGEFGASETTDFTLPAD